MVSLCRVILGIGLKFSMALFGINAWNMHECLQFPITHNHVCAVRNTHQLMKWHENMME